MIFNSRSTRAAVALCAVAATMVALAADPTETPSKTTRKAAQAAAQAAAAGAPKTEIEPTSSKAGGVKRGRYLAILGGCNDCHTSGYAPTAGQVPETQWLLGDSSVGFRGPWGTTYAPNLRRVAAKVNEDEWVRYARDLKTRPPMPWFTLKQWSEADLRALYRYIRQLGPAGDATMAFVPPETAPKGPVIQWPAPPK